MKALSTTTVAGTLAASALLATQCPGIPHWLEVTFMVTTSLALALLGKVSVDCPPDCPGTNGHGHRWPEPKPSQIIIPILVAFGAALIILALPGCTTANPAHVPGDTNTQAYIVSPALNTASNTAAQIAGPAGVATGTGQLPVILVSTVFGLLAALSGLLARHKSQTADVMAAGIIKAGLPAVQAVLTHASDSTKYAVIAEMLNSSTPPGQAPGQPCTADSCKITLDSKV